MSSDCGCMCGGTLVSSVRTVRSPACIVCCAARRAAIRWRVCSSSMAARSGRCSLGSHSVAHRRHRARRARLRRVRWRRVRATGGERRQRGAPCLVAQLELARLLRALVLARPRLDVGHALGGRLALTREFGLLHAVLGVALLLRRRLLLEALALLIRRPVGIVLGGAATALRECGALALKALAISLALWRGRRLLRASACSAAGA
jgi:hypothetical protein